MEANNSINEPKYLKAKKKVNDIRGFYIHAIIYAIIIPVIIYINLEFVPDYHWFWYSLIGMSLGLFFHWLGVLGLEKLGLGKDWEEKKIKELMEKEDHL
jgi:hypothetical protein